MRFIYYYAGSVNGENVLGHYIRSHVALGLVQRSSTPSSGSSVSATFACSLVTNKCPAFGGSATAARAGGRAANARGIDVGDCRAGGRRGRESPGRERPDPSQLPAGAVNDRRSQSLFTNRIMIGALTVLVLIVAVFLAYTANSGLPFVPTYDVNADVPDAAGLIASDGVLIGGARVGFIGSITAAKLRQRTAVRDPSPQAQPIDEPAARPTRPTWSDRSHRSA